MGAERYALLGDFVGYGADPAWCVAKAMELVEGGAIAVIGNHDAAIGDPGLRMREEVMTTIDGRAASLARRSATSSPDCRSLTRRA